MPSQELRQMHEKMERLVKAAIAKLEHRSEDALR